MRARALRFAELEGRAGEGERTSRQREKYIVGASFTGFTGSLVRESVEARMKENENIVGGRPNGREGEGGGWGKGEREGEKCGRMQRRQREAVWKLFEAESSDMDDDYDAVSMDSRQTAPA